MYNNKKKQILHPFLDYKILYSWIIYISAQYSFWAKPILLKSHKAICRHIFLYWPYLCLLSFNLLSLSPLFTWICIRCFVRNELYNVGLPFFQCSVAIPRIVLQFLWHGLCSDMYWKTIYVRAISHACSSRHIFPRWQDSQGYILEFFRCLCLYCVWAFPYKNCIDLNVHTQC